MSVIDYTTYDAIRAVLGVDSIELPDTTISLQHVENKVAIALSRISGVLSPDTETRTLAEHYTYIDGLETPTVDQQDFNLHIELYAMYVAAAAVGASLSMFAPKTKSSGKVLSTRFAAESTFRDVLENVNESMGSIREYLLVALGDSESSMPYLTVVQPATDPVVEE